MTRVLIIRHGQSEWNALGKWQGRADPPLTALGRAQADAAGLKLAADDGQHGIDAVVTSNLQRAHHTGRAIAATLELAEPTVIDDLAERDAGEWSGLTRPEIDEQWPGYLADGRRPPGYEADEPLLARVLGGLADVRSLGHASVAVVSHGGVIYTIEQSLGLDFERIPNLGARWFMLTDDGPVVDSDRLELIDDATQPGQI